MGAQAPVGKGMGQDAALQEGLELVIHKYPQIGHGDGFGLGVQMHQAVQRDLLGAVAPEGYREVIRRTLGLPADGLHVLRPKSGPHTVSYCATRGNSPGASPLLSACILAIQLLVANKSKTGKSGAREPPFTYDC